MCVKYVNASARCFKSITSKENNVMSYDIPFVSIRSNNDENGVYINDFVIVTSIDFLGTNNEDNKKENLLENKKIVDFIIRLTKCSSKEEERIGYDLEEFSINLEEMYEKNKVNTACYDFLNYTRTTNVEKLYLPGGLGKYVIKVLIKDSEDTKYSIQTISQLMVL